MLARLLARDKSTEVNDHHTYMVGRLVLARLLARATSTEVNGYHTYLGARKSVEVNGYHTYLCASDVGRRLVLARLGISC